MPVTANPPPDLSSLSGHLAQVWLYTVSLKRLWIRFVIDDNHGDLEGSPYLVFAGCESLPQQTDWTVGKITVTETSEDGGTLCTVADESAGISFKCCSWARDSFPGFYQVSTHFQRR